MLWLVQMGLNRMPRENSKSDMTDKWDKIFRDICREIIRPLALDDQAEIGPHLEIGWQRDAAGLDESGVLHAEAECLIVIEDDAHAATMLGTADQFDLGDEGSGMDIDDSQSADLATDSDSSSSVDVGRFHEPDPFNDACFFGVGDPFNDAFELGDDCQCSDDSLMLSSSSSMLSSSPGRWVFAPYTLSGILERVLCEPQDGFSNEDPEYPSDSYMTFWYKGPWRRRVEPALLFLSLTLMGVWGVALLVFVAGENFWSAETKNSSVGFAIWCVAGVVFLVGVLEIIGLFRHGWARLLFRRRDPSKRYP